MRINSWQQGFPSYLPAIPIIHQPASGLGILMWSTEPGILNISNCSGTGTGSEYKAKSKEFSPSGQLINPIWETFPQRMPCFRNKNRPSWINGWNDQWAILSPLLDPGLSEYYHFGKGVALTLCEKSSGEYTPSCIPDYIMNQDRPNRQKPLILLQKNMLGLPQSYQYPLCVPLNNTFNTSSPTQRAGRWTLQDLLVIGIIVTLHTSPFDACCFVIVCVCAIIKPCWLFITRNTTWSINREKVGLHITRLFQMCIWIPFVPLVKVQPAGMRWKHGQW